MPATTAARVGGATVGVIAATKLQAPQPRLELVPRDALVALSAGGPQTRLTLLSAPGGSGKTTLLTLWNASPAEDRPFAWLSLEEADNDPVRFWACVIEALRTLRPGAATEAEGALLSPGTSLEQVVVPLLVNDLVTWRRGVVLVLDDLHVVHDAQVHRSLAHLLDRLPPTLQLAIATREDPPLPLARLRARGELVEIRTGHLRFSDAEAEAFLNSGLGIGLEAAEIAQIQERTEGWAAGLQLAGLSLRDRAERAAFLAAFSGDDSHVVEYLAGEILAGVEPQLRDYMARTSILERMSAELCEAVSRVRGALEMRDAR